MNEEEAFIAALAADPSDRTAALVFADWLEEHGDPRGSMLRIDEVRAWMRPKYGNPIPTLLAALESGKQITQASRALSLIGEAAVPALVALLTHNVPIVRTRAVKTLRQMGPRAKIALPALFAMVKDTDNSVRREAALAAKDIGISGSTDTATLREALSDKDSRVRYQAAELLGSMRAKRSVAGELAKGLDSPDPAQRLAALQAMGTLRTKTAAGVLCKALADMDLDVRRLAARQLSHLAGPTMKAAVEPLRKALGEPDAEVRYFVKTALGRIGPTAVAALPDLLGEFAKADIKERKQLLLVIAQVGKEKPEALEVMLTAIRDPDPDVRANAVSRLSMWSALPASAAPVLLGFLRTVTNNTWSTQSAVNALTRITDPPQEVIDELRSRVTKNPQIAGGLVGKLGPQASMALPELIAAFQPGDWNVMIGIAQALGKHGGEGITALVRALDHGSDEGINRFRNAAAGGLKVAGTAALPVLPDLIARIRRPIEPIVRARLIDAIAAMGPGAASAIPDLIALLSGLPFQNRSHTVLGALRAFGPAVVPFVPQLAELLRQPPQELWAHHSIVRLLTSLVPHGANVLEVFREVLGRAIAGTFYREARIPPAGVALTAIEGLAALGPVAVTAIPDLTLAFQAFGPDVRRVVIVTYGKIGGPALPHIHSALVDPVWKVRLAAIEALGDSGDTSHDTLAALRNAENDAARRVRVRAAAILKKITGRKGKPA